MNINSTINFSNNILKECEFCLKKYRHKNTLLDHLYRIHKSDFIDCPICDLKFHDQKKFQDHLQRHTDCQYSCQKCKRPFSDKYHVEKHQKNSCKAD